MMKNFMLYFYYLFFIILIIISLYFIYLYFQKKIGYEHFDNTNQTNSGDDANIINYDNYNNILVNGDFANGSNVSGYTDQSGFNEIKEYSNPSHSKYVLHQKDTNDLTYYEIIQPVSQNTSYLFVMWVKVSEPINPASIDFSKLFRVRILRNNGSNELPSIHTSIVKTMQTNDSSTWHQVQYLFSTSNTVRENMNLYLNYTSELIGKDIYFAGLSLYKVLMEVRNFTFTNGLMAFISGFYCDNGSMSWRDLSTLENNFTLKNRATVNGRDGYVQLYNNIATQDNGRTLFGTKPIFMINALLSLNADENQEEESYGGRESILAIRQKSTNEDLIALYLNDDGTLTLKCGSVEKRTPSKIILLYKTLLSIGFNNDTHILTFYQDSVPLLSIDNCPSLLFDSSTLVINGNQYLPLQLHDLIVHNYILLEKEHRELRTYLMDHLSRFPQSNPSIFDYIFPSSLTSSPSSTSPETQINDSGSTSTSTSSSMSDDFYRSFVNKSQLYENVKKESCGKPEVKPSDCPTAYRKEDGYYIYLPKGSYYHNKLGYYGEKFYGKDKAKVKYVYENNFPDCELPVILTDDEGRQYANSCPFIIEKNNPCGMVGCGAVDWNTKYVEDLGLGDKCKKAVSYYCRINYDLDPKCEPWKPDNRDDPHSKNIRNYFEDPNEYCQIGNYKIEDHPDFKKYIRKDKIPCWNCKLD